MEGWAWVMDLVLWLAGLSLLDHTERFPCRKRDSLSKEG